MTDASAGKTLRFAAVAVHFPFVPYRAQNALMHSVITAIRDRQHALIESPTGTGKSLALLCASLAYQQHLREQHESPSVPAPEPQQPQQSLKRQNDHDRDHDAHPLPPDDAMSSDSDFQPAKKFRDVSWQIAQRKTPAPIEDERPANAFMLHRIAQQCDRPLDASQSSQEQPIQSEHTCKSKRVPRIFYATRTHNQVAQVIAELRKTSYRPRISVLASRKEYCVREEVRTDPQRDHLCKSLVKASQCDYYFQAASLASSPQLSGEAWDIEELTELGKLHAGCAYYASHELYHSAELILCPYSFLVDPIVRRSRGINLLGDVVILDEAHNIENYARESASFQADVADMRRAAEEVDTLLLTGALSGERHSLAPAYLHLKSLLECMLQLAENVAVQDRFEQKGHYENAVFEQEMLLNQLEHVDVTEEQVLLWRAAHDFIVNFGDGNEGKRMKRMKESESAGAFNGEDKEDGLSSGEKEDSKDKSTSNVYGYGRAAEESEHSSRIGTAEPKYRKRGRKLRGRGKRSKTRSTLQEDAPWIVKCVGTAHALLTTLEFLFSSPRDFCLVVDRRTVEFVTVVTISIVCLNAGVCFRDLSTKARTVIVTSGTLAPISSFAGELDTKFGIAKSLPHVVDVRKQLFVSVVGHGPDGVLFDATFNGSGKFAFQDSLGAAIYDYCQVIPGGVLVFLPSYRLLDQLQSRWKASGAWHKLQEKKGAVLIEPNQRGEEFDAVLAEYASTSSSADGAILFGVCRGKLSEGIDFRDASSRAVILIGIPFPHKGDVVVNRKRLWNDRMRREKSRQNLQTGAEWYEMQAFRALNQALGRAVRHRLDYGAILLVDARFRQQRVIDQLPGWMRSGLQTSNSKHEALLEGLVHFYGSAQERIASISV